MKNETIKVLLVDDHDVVLAGLKIILSRNNDIKIVGDANDGEDTLVKVDELKPDIVILDINLPKLSGIGVTKKITKSYPEIKVILHTVYTDEENIINGFEAGAYGYVPKTFNPDQLIDAIKMVHKGERYIKSFVSDVFISGVLKIKKTIDTAEQAKYPISDREVEILKLFSDGLSSHSIADKLNLSQRTIETHKYNIMKKLNVSNTAELVRYAIKNQLAEI